MNLTPVLRFALQALVFLLIPEVRLSAQNILITEYKGKFLPVVRAHDPRPYVQVDGKQVAAEGRQFGLHKVEEYLPVFISVRDIDVVTTYAQMDSSAINHEFKMRAKLVTPYALADVFIVLEPEMETAGKAIFMMEVGEVRPREPKTLSLRVPMTSALGAGKYQIHLFSEGAEVLNSSIDAGHCDAVVDRMTAKRIESVQDAAPKLFFGPPPEYPEKLLKTKISGTVMVGIRIGPNGRFYDPDIKSASDPAFGESALTAVRLWRFLPRVKGGRPMETVANMPMNFTPPPEEVKKS